VLPNTGSHAWIFALGAGIIAVALSLWAFARWRRRNQGHE
jgi:LPXTG-motif cell wall-anchored protein